MAGDQVSPTSSLSVRRWLALIAVHEYERIAKKGWWMLMALLSNIICLSLFRAAAERYWPLFVDKYQDNRVPYAFLISATAILFHAVGLLFYCSIEYFGLFQQYKISKKSMWDIDPNGWSKLRNRSIWLNFINIYVFSIGVAYLVKYFDEDKLYSISKEIPSLTTIAIHVYFCICIESAMFFLLHIVGHKYLYKWHKVHHQFSVPHALSANHSDPIDYLVGTALPTVAGIVLLGNRTHILTVMYWVAWRLSEGFSNHCNYDFDWSLFRIVPFSAGSSYHSFHHTHNMGNYGSFLIVQDTITETNHDYYQHIGSRLVH